MAPFLVAATEVTSVADVDSEAHLATYRVPSSGARTAASGASKPWHMHYTNIRRSACLARSHPMVDGVTGLKLHKQNDARVEGDYGRVRKGHQSPWDLHLTLASRAEIYVGVSVNDASSHITPALHAGLLSMWWKPAAQQKLTPEQEGKTETLDLLVAFDLRRPRLRRRPPSFRNLAPSLVMCMFSQLGRQRRVVAHGAWPLHGVPLRRVLTLTTTKWRAVQFGLR